MSYTRRTTDGGVYTFEDMRGNYWCQICPLSSDGDDYRTRSVRALRAHLLAHQAAGHPVRDEAIGYVLSDCPWWFRLAVWLGWR